MIDNFLHRSNDAGAALFYDKVADFARGVVTSNIAHVVFLTNDVAFSKSLSKALPGRVFHQIALGDCSPEVAKRFVMQQLDAKSDEDKGSISDEKGRSPFQKRTDLDQLDEVIGQLGGRLTDLEFLAR